MYKNNIPRTVRVNTKYDKLTTKIEEQSELIDALEAKLEVVSEDAEQKNREINNLRQDLSDLKRLILAVDQRAGRMRLDQQIRHGLNYFRGKRNFVVSKTETPLDTSPREIPLLPAPASVSAPALEPKTETALVSKMDSHPQLPEKDDINADIAIICPSYPGGSRSYGGEFVQRRVAAYTNAGLDVVVIEIRADQKEVKLHKVENVRVLRIDVDNFKKILETSPFKIFAVHSIEKPVWTAIKPKLSGKKAFVWVHGFEARQCRKSLAILT